MLPDSPAERHRSVAATFAARVAGAQDWEASAPVEGWVARDVVRHLIDWFPGFLAGGAGMELPAGPPVDDDPVGAWHHQTEAIQAILDDPATASKTYSNPMTGDMPLPVMIQNFYTADVFMHTWDLARASGQDDTLDEAECAEVLAGMQQMAPVIRASGQFGDQQPVADDASAQEKLIAFIGRDPHWSR